MTQGFGRLEGKTIIAIDGAVKGSERITILCSDRTQVTLFHAQDCCEHVRVEDVAGDPTDLVGHVVVLAEEAVNPPGAPGAPADTEFYGSSFTWTFYKLRTHGGDLTIRWLGDSNGYYSESVDMDVETVPLERMTPMQQVLMDKAPEGAKA